MPCKTCKDFSEELQCREIDKTSKEYWSVTCEWCVFKAGLEPTNRGATGWQILGVKVADGLYFAFKGKDDGHVHPIHITCFCCLADTKSRLQILNRSSKWWLYTNKKCREYPSAESFRLHYPKYFGREGLVASG